MTQPLPSQAPPSPFAALQDSGRAGAIAALQGVGVGSIEAALNAAYLAQLEAQGMLPDGTVARLRAAQAASAAMPPPGPPENVYRDAQAFCDTNGDGYDEVLMNDYNLVTLRPTVRMLDGRTGRSLWIETNTMWFHAGDILPQDMRQGEPVPLRAQEPKNQDITVDLDKDGICDFYTHTFQITGQQPIGGRLQGFIRAHSGAQAYFSIWEFEYMGLVLVVSDPLGAAAQCIEIQGFPTGFLGVESPAGPRLVFKTTDLHRCMVVVQDPTTLIGPTAVINAWTADHVRLFDGATGAILWTRDLEYSASANRTEYRWLTGAAQLDDTPEFEVVLDQFWIANPRSNRQVDDPASGDPVTRNGRGMDVLALAGDSGQTLWMTPVYDELAARVNPPAQEEGFEELRITHAYILGDVTGDGRDEVMAQMLMQESAEATSVNGQFRTHFVPLDGGSGDKLWGSVRYQGWGHAQAVHGPDGFLVAVGTMDVPTQPPPQSRFPPKDLRLAMLEVRDGTARWTHQAQYPQDSMIGYDLALQQFRLGLAPVDADGDGWADPITPSQYVQPRAGQQVLLSQATQRYEVLSAMTGKTLRSIETFGSNGMVVPCGDGVLAVGGYGGHLEASQVDVRAGKTEWEEILFIDPTPTSAVAGIDMTFLSARCQATPDNRTFVGVNAGLYSQKRNTEILNLYGYPHSTQQDAEGQDPVWMVPNHLAKRQLLEKLAALLEDPAPVTVAQRTWWAAIPAFPGLLLGALAGVVANRRAPLPPRPAKLDLPDLYGGS